MLGGLLACSPFACRSVVNKAAFNPDRRALAPNLLPQDVTEAFFQTSDGIQLQSYFLKNQDSEKLVIYFHGNAGNLSHRIPDLQKLHQLGASVLGVSYRGYGSSQGSPSETGIYKDGDAAFKYATEKLGNNEEDIYLFGRSLGTTVAIHTAQGKNIGGMILVSPLTNAQEMGAAAGMGSFSVVAGSAFDNIGKVSNIQCPTLVIHGTADQVIPYSMGVRIHQGLNVPKKLVSLEGAGHNDLSTDFQQQYWKPISGFLNQGI